MRRPMKRRLGCAAVPAVARVTEADGLTLDLHDERR
jgi:hypothetical protein